MTAFSSNAVAGYTFRKYLISLSYSKENGSIAPFQPHSDSVTNQLVLSAENLINTKSASLVLSVPVTIASWWTMHYNTTVLWQQINALYKGGPLRAEQVNISMNALERFTLPKNFSIEVSGFYQSATLGGIVRVKAMGMLDMGIKKKLPGKAGTVIFNATNMLNTGVFRTSTDLPKQNLVNTLRMTYSQPTYKLTYSRSFGKEKLKAKRERVTGSEEERNRVQ